MFLFQLYGRYVQTNIPVLLPLMVSAISIPGPQNVSPNWRNHFVDLKGAQVKTVSFLTYLLRSFAEYIRPHEESISKSIVNLLVTCPDSVSIRKELLVATRHVLSTDFRRGLYPLIDTLLEERLMRRLEPVTMRLEVKGNGGELTDGESNGIDDNSSSYLNYCLLKI
ncbi:transcription-associated protein 1 isoform X1 [Amborella trichopoda]|uniref:transcription-associated protein 1 isoform X1 n=1 Tax=Amborella trichopoda TaxID=13333 RepID=UPI0009BCE19C|nr:transcription-associated protein 1 isoform X1 [Amborella trichopoda]|eukprot:XP_006830340.2 transcription-associated protein 1 isoform X1 [Amborella trichopoda]